MRETKLKEVKWEGKQAGKHVFLGKDGVHLQHKGMGKKHHLKEVDFLKE